MLAKLDVRKNVLTIGTSFTELSLSRESVGPPSLPVLKWFRETEMVQIYIVHPGRTRRCLE